ncbi:MAG: sigma factor [Eubacteriales bacterium]
MINTELDMLVNALLQEKDENKINQFINSYQPFVIKIISDIKKAYVNLDQDEEFSVGLSAFYEAIKRYDKDKGHFLSYAKLVIISRLNNYWQKENKNKHTYLEDSKETLQFVMINNEEDTLKNEIEAFEIELDKFGIDFECLVDQAPKHKDTRDTAIEIAKKTSEERDLLHHIFSKKRLPITKMSERFFISVKVIKRNKHFIIAVIIILVKKFTGLSEWTKIDKKGPKIDMRNVYYSEDEKEW